MKRQSWLIWMILTLQFLLVCGVGYFSFQVKRLADSVENTSYTVGEKQIAETSLCDKFWYHVASDESKFFNFVSFLASFVTIGGIGAVWFYYYKSRVSRKCQEKILLDLVRHVFVNCAIVEIIRIKLAADNGCRPADGVLQRFAFLDNDMDLGRFSVTSANFDKIHSACLSMRNYNVSAMVAERHNADGSCSCEQRIADLDELFDRGVAVTKKLIDLAEELKLDVSIPVISEYLEASLSKSDRGMYDTVVDRKDIMTRKCSQNHSFFDDKGLYELMDRCIFVKASTIRIVKK